MLLTMDGSSTYSNWREMLIEWAQFSAIPSVKYGIVGENRVVTSYVASADRPDDVHRGSKLGKIESGIAKFITMITGVYVLVSKSE